MPIEITDEGTPLLEGMLNRLEGGLQEPLLGQLIDIVHAAFQAQFMSAGAYAGTPWPLLAESTLRKKRGPSAMILVDTGSMWASLTERDAAHGYAEVLADGWTLAVGTDLEYAGFHQSGTARMPARPPAPANLLDQDQDLIAELIGNYIAGTD